MTATKFRIMAVHKLNRQEQEDWWEAVMTDRVARSALFSMRETEKTFEKWAEMAGWPGYDVNVIYAASPAPSALYVPVETAPLATQEAPKAPKPCDSQKQAKLAEPAKLAYFWTCGGFGHGAFFHFNYLTAGLPYRMEIGKYVLETLKAAGYKCLAGLTAANKRHVIAYAEACGGKAMGRWPGTVKDAARNVWVDGVLIQFILED